MEFIILVTSAKVGIKDKEVFVEVAKLLYGEHLKYKERNKKLDNDKDKVLIPIKVTKAKSKRKKVDTMVNKIIFLLSFKWVIFLLI